MFKCLAAELVIFFFIIKQIIFTKNDKYEVHFIVLETKFV